MSVSTGAEGESEGISWNVVTNSSPAFGRGRFISTRTELFGGCQQHFWDRRQMHKQIEKVKKVIMIADIATTVTCGETARE